MKRCILAVCLLVIACMPIYAAEKIKVLIVDGQNNHNWKATTPVLKSILEESGRFTVDVATSPPRNKKEELEKFKPDFSKYDVVLSNYNGREWSDATKAAFVSYLKNGGGLVIIHAANNSFGRWQEYNRMIGMGWRNKNYGPRLKLDDEGKVIKVPKGEDNGSGHRYSGIYQITVRDSEHPITNGMPQVWMHARDELYDNLRGPIENVHLLATAYSKGTKFHEPMIWTVSYGKGRVFHTPMGHDVRAMKCRGFAVTVQRGTEWAATGKVTIPIPKDFPTENKVSTEK